MLLKNIEESESWVSHNKVLVYSAFAYPPISGPCQFEEKIFMNLHRFVSVLNYFICTRSRAREIIGFAGSGPIFETENRFISRQEAKKSIHKTLYFSRFWNTQTDIVTCQNCSHLIIRCYLS